MKIHSTFNKPVVVVSLLFCSLIIGLVLFDSQQSIHWLLNARAFIFERFNWLYVIVNAFFIFFLAFLVLSNYGNIKLGLDEEEPELSLKSWYALLFTAGMGIGVIFLGVAEPLSHSIFPISVNYVERQAVFQSIFHWSINAWAIYGVIALSIAYFGFRYKLPLSLRSCFYPLLKQKIDGKLGDIIDILGLCTTIFGLITTLAYSAVRLIAAFEERQFWFSDKLTIQVIIGTVFIIAIIISTQRVTKGLRIVSELSLVLSLFLMLFVLCVGPTAYLLSTFTENIGFYLNSFIELGLKTYIYEPEHQKWFNEWTILYWAWWFSWAPSFGIFIARISKGRTIREFVLGVLLVPSLFFIAWFTIFGNGAIWVNEYLANGKLGEILNQTGKLLFVFLDYLPFSSFSNHIAFILVLLFFITTVDFGVYILNNISIKDKSVISPRWQIVFWGAIITSITFILFQIGGIEAMQGTMLMFSLPFVCLMFLMVWSLYKGLRFDYVAMHKKEDNQRWLTDNWREQVQYLLMQSDERDTLKYTKSTIMLAMRELRQELIGVYGVDVHLESNLEGDNKYVIFMIDHFYYRIDLEKEAEDNTGNMTIMASTNINYGEKHNIQHLKKDELIFDILKRYDIYLSSN
ncbi:BCCT family transporter [Actinobacillus indolicus]|uniref:BCCT family transporter n=1 Tax=Actinobacillus indolicus TaxID=51049 RepID=A0A4P7CHV8_9PAST|nr:BCCT family transporter [Actinobacillus indolicus]QBQ62821.1 BCCT family transporter [Actinobacillus indolicus]